MTKAVPYNAATIYAVQYIQFIQYVVTCLIEPKISLCVMDYENILLKFF